MELTEQFKLPWVYRTDRNQEFIGTNGRIMKCRLRVWGYEDRLLILLTEIDDNPGGSVTNCAELIASQLLGYYGVALDAVTWIEHYPADLGLDLNEHYDLLTFTPIDRRWAGLSYGDVYLILDDPVWRPLDSALVESFLTTHKAEP